MAQTIDYKVNIDVGQAMADLQMVDMQMDSSFGGPPGTSFQGSRQMVGDMGYAAGQMAGRIGSPFAEAGGFYGGQGPQMNFGTAAFTALHPNLAGSPMGVSRQAWHAQSQAHMAAGIGRGATGAALGFMGDAGGLVAGAAVGGLATMLGAGAIGAGIVGVGAFMGVTALAGKVAEGVGTRNMMQDVVMSTSGMGLGGSRVAERAITNMQHANPLLNTEDMMNIAVTGHGMGMLGGESPQEYLKKFRKLTSDVQEVATVLNTSLAEGMQVMGQLQGAGVGAGAITTLAGMGGGDPSRIKALIGTGMMGSAAFSGTGMSRGGGFWQAIQTSGVAGSMGLSSEYMTQAGGQGAVTGMLLGSNINFLQSGAGMMMQAGVWQGGTAMGSGGGMGAMDMMQAGVGNISDPGDYFSFVRNRANATGRMSASERLRMEGKFNVDLASMAADQLGADTGDMLFYQGMQRYGNAPQAEAWALAQQRYAKGGGGGGPSKTQLIDAQIERSYAQGEQRHGTAAVTGRIRDSIDSWFNETFVDPVIQVQDAWVGAVSSSLKRGHGTLGVQGSPTPSAPRDLVLSSVEGRLEGALSGETGLSVASMGWSGHYGRTLDTLGVDMTRAAGPGMLEISQGSFASISEIYAAQRRADEATNTGWNTQYQRISSGRNQDYERQLRQLRLGVTLNQPTGVSDIFRTRGYMGAATAVGADVSTSAGAAAFRTVSEEQGWGVSPEAVGGLFVHQGVAAAAGDRRDQYMRNIYQGMHGESLAGERASMAQGGRWGATGVSTGVGFGIGALAGGIAATGLVLAGLAGAPFSGGLSLVAGATAAGAIIGGGIFAGHSFLGGENSVRSAGARGATQGFDDASRARVAAFVEGNQEQFARFATGLVYGTNALEGTLPASALEAKRMEWDALRGYARAESAWMDDYGTGQGQRYMSEQISELAVGGGRSRVTGSYASYPGEMTPEGRQVLYEHTQGQTQAGTFLGEHEASAAGIREYEGEIHRRVSAVLGSGTITYDGQEHGARGISRMMVVEAGLLTPAGQIPQATQEWMDNQALGGKMIYPTGRNEMRLRTLEGAASLPGGLGEAGAALLTSILNDPNKAIDELGATAVDLGAVAGMGSSRNSSRRRDNRSVVPIALGADATERELYNSVRGLYQAVKLLKGSIPRPTTTTGEDGVVTPVHDL